MVASATDASDLEVVPAEQFGGLQSQKPTEEADPSDPTDTFKEAYREPSAYPHVKDGYQQYHAPVDAEAIDTPRKRRRTCGFAPKTCALALVLVVIVVIAAAVGGGVGGSQSHKSHAAKPTSTPAAAAGDGATSDANTSSSPSSSSTPTTSSTQKITTTTTSSPKYTLLSDCPSSNNTIYSPADSGMGFRKLCRASFLNSNSPNVVSQQAASLDECIDMCAGYDITNRTAIAAGSSTVCNAVCWRATIEGDDYPGVCFGFTTQNSTGQFSVQADTRCNSAAWINQSFG